jgi:Fe-S-cluster containining protein
MACDASPSSPSFVRSEMLEIAQGRYSLSLSPSSQSAMNSLLEMGVEGFTLTPILTNHLLKLAIDRSESKMRLHIDIVYGQLFLWMLQIHPFKKGQERATLVQNLIDRAIAKNVESRSVSCRKSCAFCCHTPVSITRSEVDQIYAYLESNRGHRSDEKASKAQEPRAKGACAFLGKHNECGIYAARPVACRKLLSVSQPELCNSERSNSPTYLLQIEAELIASAFYSIESSSQGVTETIADHFGQVDKRNHCRSSLASNFSYRSETSDI